MMEGTWIPESLLRREAAEKAAWRGQILHEEEIDFGWVLLRQGLAV